MTNYTIIHGDCAEIFKRKTISDTVHLTFLDPPFNQSKEYAFHDDDLPDEVYWQFMNEVCRETFALTAEGGAIYFMQREKNTENVFRCLREAGWCLQNLIIWKKKTSAVPNTNKFGKHYQIIAYATKGRKARVFHRLRISPPLPPNYKYERENGVFVTDVWDDIRELTSGYFAGDEAIRNESGERFHKQQAPISLLLRIVLASSAVGDTVFDPFAGTGTTLVVATQLQRRAVGVEIDPQNVRLIHTRLKKPREADNLQKYYADYKYTENLPAIWVQEDSSVAFSKHKQSSLFQ